MSKSEAVAILPTAGGRCTIHRWWTPSSAQTQASHIDDITAVAAQHLQVDHTGQTWIDGTLV